MSSKIIPIDVDVMERDKLQREIDTDDIDDKVNIIKVICGLILIIVHVFATIEVKKCSSLSLEIRIIASVVGLLCIVIPYASRWLLCCIYTYVLNTKITEKDTGCIKEDPCCPTDTYTVFMLVMIGWELLIILASFDNRDSCIIIISVVGGFNLFVGACMFCGMMGFALVMLFGS